jgi:5-methylcytosine-specific restriction endonuclease McrA
VSLKDINKKINYDKNKFKSKSNEDFNRKNVDKLPHFTSHYCTLCGAVDTEMMDSAQNLCPYFRFNEIVSVKKTLP